MACASLGTSKEKTLSLSADLRRENRIASPSSRLSWYVSRWTSLLRVVDSNPRRQGSNFYDSHCHDAGSDPVGSGFVASLARPGGNITGLYDLPRRMGGKRLELLKEIVPRLSRVAVLGSSTQPGNAQALREMELAAGTFGVRLQYLDVLSSKDIETAFRAASKGRADALFVIGSPVLNSHRTRIADFAVKSRLL